MLRALFVSTIFAFILSSNASNAFDWSTSQSEARQNIYIVGSSTISPFMSTISEEFSRKQNEDGILTRTPNVESTGSTVGFKMFCSGLGYKYPDFANASRAIKDSEKEICTHNNVKKIIEIKIGYDGIVIGNLAKSKKIKLTKEQIFLALAEKVYDPKSKKLVKNFYETWDQIDPSLPKTRIAVYGPPLTSGTREVFANIVMEEICLEKKEFQEAFPNFYDRQKQCYTLRDDEKFIESGENDRLIIEHLKQDPNAFGIFGFNFLIENQKTIQAAEISGVTPTFETISSKKYPLSRPLFVYFKKEHLNLTPGMRSFIKEIIDPETIGRKGYLVHNGLITLSDKDLKQVRKNILSQL